MREEFLKELGVGEEAIDKILSKLKKEKLEEQIKESLAKNGVLDMDAAGALLDKDGISEENLQEKIEDLKTLHPAIFKKDLPQFITNADTKENIDRRNFEKMTYAQRLDLFKKNPGVYKKFTE